MSSSASSFDAFELFDCEFLKGESVLLSTLKGKQAAVVELWATWCPPCRDSIPHVSALQKKFDDVVFVGVTSERDDKPAAFVKQMGDKFAYRVAQNKSGRTVDSYMKAANAQGIPIAFVINKQSRVVWHGHPMDAAFEEAVVKCRAEVGAAEQVHVPQTPDELSQLKVAQLRKILDQHNVIATDCFEKSELVERIMQRIVSKS